MLGRESPLLAPRRSRSARPQQQAQTKARPRAPGAEQPGAMARPPGQEAATRGQEAATRGQEAATPGPGAEAPVSEAKAPVPGPKAPGPGAEAPGRDETGHHGWHQIGRASCRERV